MARTTWGRTRASDEGVWVHNGFTSSHVPWDEVQRITHPRYDDATVPSGSYSGYAVDPYKRAPPNTTGHAPPAKQ